MPCDPGASHTPCHYLPHPLCRWTLKYDNIAKPFAFLCVAHFFKAFPTPEKIQLQVYVALCRLSQNPDPAAKEAVRKGIDIMIPNLAKAAANEAGAAGSSLPGLPVGDAGDSVISKDSAMSGAGVASGAAAPAAGAAGSGSLAGSPGYARYLKRVLSEDGHVSITLVHLLQVIVRNRDMFYQSR